MNFSNLMCKYNNNIIDLLRYYQFHQFYENESIPKYVLKIF